MAQMIVEQSPLGAFLDQLPSLLLQYKQMQYAQEERAFEREEAKAARAEGILLKEYYNKQDQIKESEKLYGKYASLTPGDVSQGGLDLVSFIDDQNNIDVGLVKDNLDKMSSYHQELKDGLDHVQEQQSVLKSASPDWAGVNTVLQEHEYEEFKQNALLSIEEGGRGWAHTAGADELFYSQSPSERFAESLRITDYMKKTSVQGAEGSYASLMAQLSPSADKKEDIDDVVERLKYTSASGKPVTPDKAVVSVLQKMVTQGDYDDFMSNVYRLPEVERKLVLDELSTNPSLNLYYGNLQRDWNQIRNLDNELAGINDKPETNNLNTFIDSIEGVTDETTLFRMYDTYTQNLDPAQLAKNDPYFAAIELNTDKDLGAGYMEYKGFAGGSGTETDVITARDLDLGPYQDDSGNLSAGLIYDALDRIEDPATLEALQSETWALTPYAGEDAMRLAVNPDQTAAKNLYGGMGANQPTNSNYYDAFRQEFQDIYQGLVEEADWLGPDFYWKSATEAQILGSETHQGLMEKNFGKEIYEKALLQAHKAGKESQISKLESVLQSGRGEDYQDLLTILDMIEED